jgi:hypothetical protein
MRTLAIFCFGVLLAACQQADVPVSNDAAAANGSVAVPVSGDMSDIANGGAATPSPNGRVSRFTTVSVDRCLLIREYEEATGWDRRCASDDGTNFLWTQGDLREDLVLGSGEDPVGLNMIVANGAFSSLGETLDWRGPAGGKADALVVRVNVAQPDSGKPDISRLAVIKLAGTPCVVAVIEPGSGQSERARAIADGKLPECLKAN